MPNAIIVAAAAGAVGAVANQYARRTVFADYHRRKAANTLRAQGADLATFAAFLDVAGLTTTREPFGRAARRCGCVGGRDVGTVQNVP